MQRRTIRTYCLTVLLTAAFAMVLAWSQTAQAQDAAFPGIGLFGGVVESDHGGEGERYGLTTRRVRDNDRMGSLSLGYEQIENGVDIRIYDPTLEESDVELEYRSVFMELKRYFPAPWQFTYYWGMRGGYTELKGSAQLDGGAEESEFRAIQVAPLALLALPFMLEDPGFLLLAFVDGASAGLTLDLVPERVWLDLQFGASLLPRHRDRLLVIDQPYHLTRTLSLVVAF